MGNSIDASHQNKRTKKQKVFREKAAEHKNKNKKENPIERVLKSTQISFYEWYNREKQKWKAKVMESTH